MKDQSDSSDIRRLPLYNDRSFTAHGKSREKEPENAERWKQGERNSLTMKIGGRTIVRGQ